MQSDPKSGDWTCCMSGSTAGLERDIKLLIPLTVEAIAPSVLATPAELDAFARDPWTLMSLLRVIQARGCKAA